MIDTTPPFKPLDITQTKLLSDKATHVNNMQYTSSKFEKLYKDNHS